MTFTSRSATSCATLSVLASTITRMSASVPEGAHEDAALAAQELLLVRDGGLERIARHDGLLHAAVVADDDVQQHLRVLRGSRR